MQLDFVLALAVLLNLATTYLPAYLRSPSSTQMATAPVTLIGFPTSTCTRRVAVVLKEKNIPYEFVTVDLTKGEQKDGQYLATKQPFGQVPVLQVRYSLALSDFMSLASTVFHIPGREFHDLRESCDCKIPGCEIRSSGHAAGPLFRRPGGSR